jgi:hypothetical protein
MMDTASQVLTTPYWYGWHDGRYGDIRRFTENHRLAQLEAPFERLDYYRGHRGGRESRISERLLKAS